MSGTLGSFPWHAKTVWADRVDGAFKARLPIGLTIPVGDFPENPWLTAFEDSASPRPGSAEVFFEESSDKGVVHPPDILVPGPPTVVPIELVVVPGLLLMWGGLRLRRAMKKS